MEISQLKQEIFRLMPKMKYSQKSNLLEYASLALTKENDLYIDNVYVCTLTPEETAPYREAAEEIYKAEQERIKQERILGFYNRLKEIK